MRAIVVLLLGASALGLAGCGDKPRVSMFPPPSPEDLVRGAQLYQTDCALCHGQPRRGDPPIFQPLVRSKVVRGDVDAFARVILSAPPHIDPKTGKGFFDDFSDADIARVANHLRALIDPSLPPVRERTVERARGVAQ